MITMKKIAYNKLHYSFPLPSADQAFSTRFLIASFFVSLIGTTEFNFPLTVLASWTLALRLLNTLKYIRTIKIIPPITAPTIPTIRPMSGSLGAAVAGRNSKIHSLNST